MALPLAAGAARLISMMTKGALRQTKRLSPFTGKSRKIRPWAKSIVGKEGAIAKTGKVFGVKDTSKIRGIATQQYARGYKHLRKHKKLYGAGLGGAAAWDFLDND
jgi:hypothetical protein